MRLVEETSSGMTTEQAAEAKAWEHAREPSKRWMDPAYVAHIERQSAMIGRFLSHPADEPLLSPDEVGALGGGSKPFERKRIIEAAGVLARRRAALDEELAGQINIQVIDYILIRSDNPNGRCVDSAAAIAECVGRSVDRVENVLRTLRSKGILHHEERRGNTGAYWVPYPRATMYWHNNFAPSAHSLIDAISGPGRAGGRPKVPGDNDRVSETPIPPVTATARQILEAETRMKKKINGRKITNRDL